MTFCQAGGGLPGTPTPAPAKSIQLTLNRNPGPVWRAGLRATKNSEPAPVGGLVRLTVKSRQVCQPPVPVIGTEASSVPVAEFRRTSRVPPEAPEEACTVKPVMLFSANGSKLNQSPSWMNAALLPPSEAASTAT